MFSTINKHDGFFPFNKYTLKISKISRIYMFANKIKSRILQNYVNKMSVMTRNRAYFKDCKYE